jgi:hypothetical protein
MRGRTNLVIHFFDKEVLDLYAAHNYDSPRLEADFRAALKIGLLFCPGRLLLPLSSYFESPLVPKWVDEWGPLFAAQEMQIVSSELDYNQFVELKREQYKREPKRHPQYFDTKVAYRLRDIAAPLSRRTRSSTQDIAAGWTEAFKASDPLKTSLVKARSGTIDQFDRALIELPGRLGGDAFIWDYAKPLLPVSEVTPQQSFELKALISRSYVRSYLDEFAGYAICDFRVGDFGCGLGPDELQRIGSLRSISRIAGLAEAFNLFSWEDILHVKDDPAFGVFAEQVRSLSSFQVLPPYVLQAFAAARRKLTEGSTKDHVVRAAAVFAEELSRIEPYQLGPIRFPIQTGVTPAVGKVDLTDKLDAILATVRGEAGAYQYERTIEALLTPLFHPVLIDPEVQTRLHGGQKRVDITYSNMASIGFFNWVATHYHASYVYVECKNYTSEVGNPELDQLAGRFSLIRGQLGMLLCRKIDNHRSLMERCWNNAADGHGFIIPLEDNDLKELVDRRRNEIDFFDLPLLKNRFNQLVRRAH